MQARIYTPDTKMLYRLMSNCFCSINYCTVCPFMLLIHSMHNQINVSTNKSIFAYISIPRKDGFVQQANNSAWGTPTSGMPLQNVVLVSMDTPLKSSLLLVPPKNKYGDFLLKAFVSCSNFAFRSNSCVYTVRAKMKCPIRGMCAVVQWQRSSSFGPI